MCVAYNHRPKLARDEINCQISSSTSQKDVEVFAKGEWTLHQDMKTFCGCKENQSQWGTFKNLPKEQKGNDFRIQNGKKKICLSAGTDDIVVGKRCNANDAKQEWSWINGGNQLMNKNSCKCLDVEGEIKSYSLVRVSCCNKRVSGQHWSCSKKFLMVGGTTLRLHVDNNLPHNPTSIRNKMYTGKWTEWEIFRKNETDICAAKP
ncbi:uncharacterized protein LOC114540419 [Dendronephthya gigantea]|uniref:uncharacterized protein LOC114540419 n=1 Tax=Dendronephthya gigantea TaxID=151771 RepID=UPI00106A7C2B|nr:uncharacterized protein LOC114540419 [Dendronephthya gigantea]